MNPQYYFTVLQELFLLEREIQWKNIVNDLMPTPRKKMPYETKFQCYMCIILNLNYMVHSLLVTQCPR